MKKILPIIIIVLLLLAIRNNIASLVKTLQNENTVANLQEDLESEEEENAFLKERLFYVKTDKFVEEEAKQKLGMLKTGEYIVIAPTTSPANQKIEINTRPNWQLWWDLFF